MNTENLSTLKIHKLTQEQYNRELVAGNIDPSALYLTPEDNNDKLSVDLLWENASLESEFGEQYIYLNLDGYYKFEVYFTLFAPPVDDDGNPLCNGEVLTCFPNYADRIWYHHSNGYQVRGVQFKTDSGYVHFTDCSITIDGDDESFVMNSNLVPLRIYGYKGGSL